MKASLAMICLIFSVASDVQANTSMGSAGTSCGDWLAEKDELLRKIHTNWVLGYLSGLNAIASKDFLAGHEYKGIASAIDKYCRENPLKKIVNASEDVAIQMMRMTK